MQSMTDQPDTLARNLRVSINYSREVADRIALLDAVSDTALMDALEDARGEAVKLRADPIHHVVVHLENFLSVRLNAALNVSGIKCVVKAVALPKDKGDDIHVTLYMN